MGYIANIVTKNKIDVNSFFYVSKTLEDVDVSLPTLIIGWKEVKEYFPDQDILDDKICDNIFWTFSKREKRHKFESDYEKFIQYVNKHIETVVNYRFFNYVLSTEQKRSNFINHLNKGNCSIYYNSRFLYVYDIANSMTLGVSLKDIEYIGINVKEFIKVLNKNDNNIVTDNLNFISEEAFQLIKDNIKIAPYLYYLKNSDIYYKINNL